MRRIDAIHLEHPFAGSRMLRDLLGREGLQVGRRQVAALMRRMRIEALCRKPDTSRKHPALTVYPYLLRGMLIERANHVWATAITYIHNLHPRPAALGLPVRGGRLGQPLDRRTPDEFYCATLPTIQQAA